MIERHRDTYIPTCDGCGQELPEEYDFRDAVNAMKVQHWLFTKSEGFSGWWEHYCPECARQMRKVVFP